MIFKNFYSLQNTQPHAFIFQLICMQLCKCINCFLKIHNKQLNQYCLNFTITKKKVFKKWFGLWVWIGLTRKKHGSSHESTRFYFESNKLSSGRVYFGSGQNFLTRFAMSTHQFPRYSFHFQFYCAPLGDCLLYKHAFMHSITLMPLCRHRFYACMPCR